MHCTIWYHLHNLKNVKNTKSNTPPLVFFTYFKLKSATLLKVNSSVGVFLPPKIRKPPINIGNIAMRTLGGNYYSTAIISRILSC